MKEIRSPSGFILLIAVGILFSFVSTAQGEWGWSPAIQSFFFDGQTNAKRTSPQVIMDKSGVSTVIWTVQSTTNDPCAVMTSTHNGSSWQEPLKISSSCYGFGEPPRILDMGDGKLMAVWLSGTYGNYFYLESSIFLNGSWQEPSKIPGTSRTWIEYDICSNSRGEIDLVLTREEESVNKVEYVHLDNNAWSASSLLSASDQVVHPSCALKGESEVVALWSEGLSVKSSIIRNRNPGPTVKISQSYDGVSYIDAIANDMGTITAIWGGTYLQSSIYDNESWGGQKFIITTPRTVGVQPSLSIDGEGRPMLAWASEGFIYSSSYNKGAWSSPRLIVGKNGEYTGSAIQLNLLPDSYGNHLYWANASRPCTKCDWTNISINSLYFNDESIGEVKSHYSYIEDRFSSRAPGYFSVSHNKNNETMLVWSWQGLIYSQNASSPPPDPKKYFLTVQRNGFGSLISSAPEGIDCGEKCSGSFYEGSTVNLGTNLACVSSWEGACSGSVCNVYMDSSKVAIVNFKKIKNLTLETSGQGSIASDPSAADCGKNYEKSYELGTIVKLSANPDPLWIFKGWLGACIDTVGPNCFLEINENASVKAIFSSSSPPPNTFSLSVSKSGNGTVSSVPTSISCGVTCNGAFTAGSTVSLFAQPDYGFAFAGWGGDCSSKDKCILTMNGNKTVSATFVDLQNHLVKVIKPSTGVISSEPAGILCGGSNRQCASTFSSAKLTATPNPGYEFIRWNGCQAPEGNICYIKPTGKMTLSAVFKKLPKFKIKISKNTLGSITSTPAGLNCPDKKKSCAVSFIKGTEVTLNAVPQSGRNFAGWSGACSGTDSCQLLMDSNKGLGANFQ